MISQCEPMLTQSAAYVMSQGHLQKHQNPDSHFAFAKSSFLGTFFPPHLHTKMQDFWRLLGYEACSTETLL